jgi:hypothetical protein
MYVSLYKHGAVSLRPARPYISLYSQYSEKLHMRRYEVFLEYLVGRPERIADESFATINREIPDIKETRAHARYVT